MDGLVAEANNFFKNGTTTNVVKDVIQGVEFRRLQEFGEEEQTLLLRILISSAPKTSKFLELQAANGIAGFLFSEMHVKEQRVGQIEVQVHPSRVSQLGLCGDSVGVVTGWLVRRDCDVVSVTLGDCTPFRLYPTRSRRFRLVVYDSPVERDSREFHFRVFHLQLGHCWRKPSETPRGWRTRDECWSPTSSQGIGTLSPLSYSSRNGWLASKMKICSLVTWKFLAILAG